MQAIVYRGKNRLRVEDVADPRIKDPRDAIVRVALTTICGTDIHLVNGNLPGMKNGRILGHECVGIVEEVGDDVRGLEKGDRVVCLSTVACGICRACTAGHTSHCEQTPVGPSTCFFGGPEEAGGLDGMQADLVRVPFADVGCVKIPDALDEVAALAASDIMPTAAFGVDRLKILPGDTLVILGAGPVGQMAVTCAHRAKCSRIIVVDREASRLDLAARFPEVETVNFSSWFGPTGKILEMLEDDHGADAVLDCVGVDSSTEWGFHNPIRAIEYAAEVVRPEGRFSIVGVYPDVLKKLPLGTLLAKNVTIAGGNCNHAKYVGDCLDYLVEHPEEGRRVFTHKADLAEMPEAYDAFVDKTDGMVKCLLVPQLSPLRTTVSKTAVV